MRTIKNQKIFITGGCGFIGHHLVNALKDENEVVIYDNLRRNAIRYTGLLKHKNVKLYKGDILDLKRLKRCMPSRALVLHLAAMVGVTSYYYYPRKTMEVNIIGGFNVVNTAIARDAEFIMSFSTSEVYGPYAWRAREDELTSQGPAGDYRWTYSVSKLAGEHMLFAYQRECGVPFVVLRPFSVYGPGQVGEGAVTLFVDRALKNRVVKVTGDGNQIRSWCYVDDVVRATLAALALRKKNKNNIFNIGNPEGTMTILNLVKTIIALSGSKSRIKFVPHRGTDVDLRIPDIKKASSLLHFRPTVSVQDGLCRTIAWFKETEPEIREV